MTAIKLWLLAALLLVASVQARKAGKEVKVRILHLSDVHNRIEPASSTFGPCNNATDASGVCFGGWARITTAIKRVLEDYPATLVLDSGDELSGTIYDAALEGYGTALLQNMVGVQAMTLGEHEFDYGLQALSSYLGHVAFPVLGACNIHVAGSPALALKRWTVVNLKQKGIKVAILGALTPSASFLTSPSQMVNVSFSEVVPAMTKCLRELREEEGKVDLVVALTHQGYAEDLKLAAEVAGIDVVVGGHSHTFLYGDAKGAKGPGLDINKASSVDVSEGAYPTWVDSKATPGKKVPVVNAFWGSRYLGYLELSVVKGRGVVGATQQPILLGGSNSSNNVLPDPNAVEFITKALVPAVEAYGNTTIGFAEEALDASAPRELESAAAGLYCWALLDNVAHDTGLAGLNGGEPVEVAILNGGSIRAGIKQGNITVNDAYAVSPFNNVISVKKVRGDALVRSIINGVGNVGASSGTGRFPQVSGLEYVYDARQNGTDRLRYIKVWQQDKMVDIDPCQYYAVATNDYVASGGDGYSLIQQSETLMAAGRPVAEAFVNGIMKLGTVRNNTVSHVVACQKTEDPRCALTLPPSLLNCASA